MLTSILSQFHVPPPSPCFLFFFYSFILLSLRCRSKLIEIITSYSFVHTAILLCFLSFEACGCFSQTNLFFFYYLLYLKNNVCSLYLSTYPVSAFSSICLFLFHFLHLSHNLSFDFSNSFSCFLTGQRIYSLDLFCGIIFINHKFGGHRFELTWIIGAKPVPSHALNRLIYLLTTFSPLFICVDFFPHLNCFFLPAFHSSQDQELEIS